MCDKMYVLLFCIYILFRVNSILVKTNKWYIVSIYEDYCIIFKKLIL